MGDSPKRPRAVPHPNSPAGWTFRWWTVGVPHPNSPAGWTFNWSSFGVPHPNSPAGRIFDWSSPGIGTAPAGAEDVLARWSAYIRKLDLRVPSNRGALWSKLFDEAPKSPLSDGDVATGLAAQDGRFTLESRLARTDFWQRYRAEFPEVNGKSPWDERTIGIWKMLSKQYAEGLEGSVVAYVDSDEAINAIVMDQPPILTDELKIIKAQVLENRKITSVTFHDVWTRKRSKALSRQVFVDRFTFH